MAASPESKDRAYNVTPWYAVQVKTTHEKRVATLLDYGGFEWFLPVYECRRYWSDRIKRAELPLFPGYIFCRFEPSQRVPILKTPSVTRIVGIGYTPIPISEQEMADIQTVVKSGLSILPHPFLQVGQRVRIEGGPLQGLEGLIIDLRKRDRLIISITLLQRSVAVQINSGWVAPIHSPGTSKLSPNPFSSSAHLVASRYPKY